MNWLKIENREFDDKSGKGGEDNLKRILFCVMCYINIFCVA